MFTHLVNYKKRGHFDQCTPTIDIEPFSFVKLFWAICSCGGPLVTANKRQLFPYKEILSSLPCERKFRILHVARPIKMKRLSKK